MEAVPKSLSTNPNRGDNSQLEGKQRQASGALSYQILFTLTQLWYRESFQSSIYMAHTLDELGVEKYLPGAAEVFSGTLSLLRTSLPPCSKNPCTPTAVLIEHISNLLILLVALEHFNKDKLCETVIICGWPKLLSQQLIRRVKLLARAFRYANLLVSLRTPQWNLLENFQKKYFRLNDTIH